MKEITIHHPEGVRLLITRYKPKAQCRDTQESGNCVPKMKKSQWLFDNGVPRSGESYDSENEFIEPTIRQKTVNQNQEKTIVLW